MKDYITLKNKAIYILEQMDRDDLYDLIFLNMNENDLEDFIRDFGAENENVE